MFKRPGRAKQRIFHKKFLISVIAVAAIFFLLRSGFYNIKKILVDPALVTCAGKEDIASAADLLGKHIFFIDEKETTMRIKERFFCIKSLFLERDFPDTVVIKLSERIPKAVVAKISVLPDLDIKDATNSSETARLLTYADSSPAAKFTSDDSGFIISRAGEVTDLPTFYVLDKNITIGRKLEGEIVQKALKVFDGLNPLQIHVNKLVIFGNQIIIKGELEILFSKENPLDRQLASLQLILQKAKIESKVIKSIDLRFNKPVVVYSKK